MSKKYVGPLTEGKTRTNTKKLEKNHRPIGPPPAPQPKKTGPLYFLMITARDDWGNPLGERRIGGMRKDKKKAMEAAKKEGAALYQYPGRQLVWHPSMEAV